MGIFKNLALPVSLALITGVSATASAQSILVTPIADARLRYEGVQQDGESKSADALTVRLRTGITASRGPLSAIVEAQGTLAVVNHYDDTVSGPSLYPTVADPENIALYRLQLRYTAGALTLTGGRQRIALDDERFVGASNWRQNGRSFDAARVEWSPSPRLQADLAYSWSVRTSAGINGTGAKPQAISGANVFANMSYRSPLGTVTGFAYLIDQDDIAVQSFRLSSQTYGMRLADHKPITPAIKATWTISYARQSDYHRNPNTYNADYYFGDVGLEVASARLGGGYEVLGADRGASLTSFQTPLASIFKFQGWADKFTTTPPDGVRDLYGSAGWTWKRLGPLNTILVQGLYHRFSSDRLVRLYGDEINLVASAHVSKYGLAARYAGYHASGFATNTAKAWLEMSYTL